jgi:hypothetical protein
MSANPVDRQIVYYASFVDDKVVIKKAVVNLLTLVVAEDGREVVFYLTPEEAFDRLFVEQKRRRDYISKQLLMAEEKLRLIQQYRMEHFKPDICDKYAEDQSDISTALCCTRAMKE